MSLLNDKFKQDGLKKGQITTLDKNTAKSLGKEENREIKFTGFQSFLKEFYDEFLQQVKCAELHNEIVLHTKCVDI